jgi:P27 family predicted phage terminase small subunit
MSEKEQEKTSGLSNVQVFSPKRNTGLAGPKKYVINRTSLYLAPPDWLSNNQKSLWEAALKFSAPDQLRTVDASVLFVWVVAQDLMQQAATQLSREPLVIKSPRTNREVPNPLVGIIAKQSALVLRAAAELGFSPCSRSRLRYAAEDQVGAEWDDF